MINLSPTVNNNLVVVEHALNVLSLINFIVLRFAVLDKDVFDYCFHRPILAFIIVRHFPHTCIQLINACDEVPTPRFPGFDL